MTRKTTTTRTKPKTRRPTAKRADSAASVVSAKYRERYADGSCGDDLAARLKKHLAADDGTTDLTKLRDLAKANGVWEDGYSKLNAGLARMSVSNRLRALLRKGGAVKWGTK
jgi:hypothetical protein